MDKNGTDNRQAERYVTRAAARENLEASDALFAELVEEIHRRGMKVILDGVFNHCGSFNKWLDAEEITSVPEIMSREHILPRTVRTTAFPVSRRQR